MLMLFCINFERKSMDTKIHSSLHTLQNFILNYFFIVPKMLQAINKQKKKKKEKKLGWTNL